ncbi:MAG TPA: serine/threonine-protein kinase, partial [Polyangiaceae bacterium]
MALLAGDLLQGRYRVAGPLGQGGMGSVFAAHEEPGGAALIVKQLRLDAPELLDSFRAEFALLSRLSHPYLARVLELGSERVRGELVHYYVAEYVEGTTLGQRARAGASAQELLRPLLDALEGLTVLHGARIRHGDFTPANVLIRSDGSGVLIDLGCARAFGPSELLAGTEGYLAPELLERSAGDARADLFAVGVTIQNAWALSGLSPASTLERLAERLCRADPDQRPSDVAEVLEALGRRIKPQKRLFLATELVGRERELRAVQDWLDAILSGAPRARVLSVQGAPGVGLTRFVRELCWRAQLLLPVLRVRAGEAGDLSRQLARAFGHETLPSGTRGALVVARELAERAEPLLLLVEDYERLASEERELLLGLTRLVGEQGALSVVISGAPPPSDIAAQALSLAPLDLDALRLWTRGLLSERKLQELLHSSAGLPAKIDAALRDQLGGERAASPKPGEAKVAAASLPKLAPAA